MMTQDKQLIPISEAAQQFGFSGQTLRAWVRKGIIRAYRQGIVKNWLVDPEEIRQKLELHEVKPDELEGDNP